MPMGRCWQSWFWILALVTIIGCSDANRKSPSTVAPIKDTSESPISPTSTEPPIRAPIQFAEVAKQLGITFVNETGMNQNKHFPTANGTAVGMTDFDLDGWPDLFFGQGCRLDIDDPNKKPAALYRSESGTAFVDVAKLAGVDIRGYVCGICCNDLNNDGFPDLYLTRVNSPYLLFINNGDGTYSNRSEGSGANLTAWGTSVAALDYDNDGNLDMYVCNYANWDLVWHGLHFCTTDENDTEGNKKNRMYCGPPSIEPARHFLLRSLGDGRFKDSLKEAGIERIGHEKAPEGKPNKGGRGQGVVACDLNNDGLIDLYVANDLNKNFTFLNLGHGKFRDITEECSAATDGKGNAQAGMGVDATDVDGDGWPDLVVTNFYREYTTLYHNDGVFDGILLFRDIAETSGVAARGKNYVKWGTSFEDLDNDGWVDLLIVNGHVDDNLREAGREQPYLEEAGIWRNLGKGKFERLMNGLSDYFNTKHSSRALAFGDLFNDGQVHAVVGQRDETPAVLKNTSRQVQTKPNSWIEFSLIGTTSNRDAIGARLEVKLASHSIVRHVRGGRSYMAAHDPRQLIGLGAAGAVEKVTIYWPSGKTQIVQNPDINRLHLIREPL